MNKRWMVGLAVMISFAAAAPALAQVPAVQEALFAYLTNIPPDFNSITAQALKAKLDAGEKVFILDVRQESEFEAGHIAGAVNIPIRTIGANPARLPAKDAAVIVVCSSGMRAGYVTMALSILGWTNVKDIAFGMTEWQRQTLPTVK
jgi:rhodanese-related sulfurtransferase